MKRLLAMLLVLVMALGLLPTAALAAKCDTAEDLWQQLKQLEDSKIRPKRGEKVTEDDFAAIIDDVVKVVEASSAYRKGTLVRHGDFLFWETKDGEVCGYSPRIRERQVNRTVSADADLTGGVETISYATRGNNPDAKDVVVIEPFYGTDSSFTKQYQNEGKSIAAATGGTYTLYKTSSATIDVIADALESSAVVIFDSHGDTDYAGWGEDYTSQANTSYLLIATGTGVTSADKAKATGEFGTYYHAFSSYGDYYVDGTAITNHMEKKAPNNLVWMAICLGMATDGLEKPLREQGVGVVYGYSQSVTFDGDYDYEQTCWTQLKNGATVADAISAMKSKHGSWDPGMGCKNYSTAIKNYAAFPIVVSNQDVYPGHGNVDNYQTVNSDWTLFGSSVSHTVNAVSADNTKGTVSMSGNTITATPKQGYAADGYTVSPEGACKVTQSGNQFTVSNVTADCTVTISFSELQKVTASFVVPEGVSCEPISVYAGEQIEFPEPKGTPAADKYNYKFVGWANAPCEDTQMRPSYVTAGSRVTLTQDKTYYALYCYNLSNKIRYTTELQSNCEHVWNDGVEQKAPTCTQQGKTLYTCTLCGETKTEPIDPLGHDYHVEVIAPTETERGYDLHICSRCGASFTDNYTAPVPATGCPCIDYTDVDREAWYHSAADFVINAGLMGSTSTEVKTFEPTTNVSRAMVASILYRIAGSGEVLEYQGTFTDVAEGVWYTGAIEWCAKEGLASGKGEGIFDPNGNVTRQELAMFFYKLAEFQGKDTTELADLDEFPDGKTVPDWAKT
ncbi:MAG: S-layer homology domain-containing protein, partial [Clostridia bacterium]|nr:S-layer homology domain-containing protein [Clostridia bacterium]